MYSYHSLLVIELLLAMVLLVPTAMSFSQSSALHLQPASSRTYLNNNRLYASDDDGGNVIGEEFQPKAEYGVSYIGGDPCGSKYNDDPFDVQVQKPGAQQNCSTDLTVEVRIGTI